MQRTVTMKDVAQQAGVSVMTVSRAFKQHASVGEETRKRILKIAEDLGYVFDSNAATFRSQRTGFVAVAIPSINNANFADTVGALSEVLKVSDLQVLLGYSNYDIREEERIVEQFLRRRPEAIVLTGGRHTDRTRQLLERANIPVIETWDLPEDPIDHVVGFSNAATMHDLVGHLVETGRRRIAFIGGDTDGDTRGADRRRGFIDAMAAQGLSSDRLIGAGEPPISMREGADAMSRLLKDFPDTEAVICVSDLSAFGALTECMRKGVKVPDDIAISGFGAYDISSICVPTLTTIDPHPVEIGRKTGEVIMSLLRGEGDKQNGPIRLEIGPQLSVGGSSA
ncbi:MAG: LacI family DNA-binding transcriptional regulator [Roseibium sp.]|uniref:LacI family DNA-binding transcriptional regulator n=1 Tax=Roseibium sp. TaxID=1936156 RepID=UPI002614FF36|nr:LacI family DNA-binding transcriptional regulator [Roseibium sp.]MCV0429780.1 LacI family DNA-binding transcriptional regulator [Roseibium sp.]